MGPIGVTWKLSAKESGQKISLISCLPWQVTLRSPEKISLISRPSKSSNINTCRSLCNASFFDIHTREIEMQNGQATNHQHRRIYVRRDWSLLVWQYQTTFRFIDRPLERFTLKTCWFSLWDLRVLEICRYGSTKSIHRRESFNLNVVIRHWCQGYHSLLSTSCGSWTTAKLLNQWFHRSDSPRDRWLEMDEEMDNGAPLFEKASVERLVIIWFVNFR
jgi:hypothetical protein